VKITFLSGTVDVNKYAHRTQCITPSWQLRLWRLQLEEASTQKSSNSPAMFFVTRDLDF